MEFMFCRLASTSVSRFRLPDASPAAIQAAFDLKQQHVRQRIASLLLNQQQQQSSDRWIQQARKLRQAAIVVPLCLIRNQQSHNASASAVELEPALLFTVRSMTLRSHAGEVSFPGGLFDPKLDTDASVEQHPLAATAIRETIEELPSIDKTSVQLLGTLSPVPDKSGTIAVTPFVAFIGTLDAIGDRHQQQVNVRWNPDEVDAAFYVPIRHVLDSDRMTMQRFRESKITVPVWRGPARLDEHEVRSQDYALNNTIVHNGQAHYRIWGLSGFVLMQFIDRVLAPMLKSPSNKL